MPTGYLVSLGDGSLDAGDAISGGAFSFTTATNLGAGQWDWTGTAGGLGYTDERETGVYYLATNGNVYFVSDFGTVDSLSSARAVSPPSYTEVASDGIVTGTAGDDVIDGSYSDADGDQITSGADSVFAGDGLDTISGSDGADTINGGGGLDVVDYSASSSAVNANLTTNSGSGGQAQGDVYAGVDGVIGTQYDDTMIGFDGEDLTPGTAYTNVFSGGAGNDSLDGRGGGDSLYGGSGEDTILGGSGNDTIYGDTDPNEGPANLITNGSFEDGTHSADGVNGLEGWSNTSGSPDSADDGAAAESWNAANSASDGTGYITMWATSTGPNESMQQTLAAPLQSGTSYTLSLDAISADNTGTWFTPTDIPVTFEILDAGTGEVLGSTTVQGTSYRTYEFDFTPSSDVSTIIIRPNSAGSGNNPSVILDNVSLVKTVADLPGADNIDGGTGDDIIFAEDGDDAIQGGTGADAIDAGSGDDTITLSDNFGNDTIIGGETGETNGDSLEINTTTATIIDLSASNAETGTISDGESTASFTEIENIQLGGARETIILADGSGADSIIDFDLTDSGDGTTNDQLDVSGLADANGAQVNTADVVVTDTNGNGTGDAILNFPGGESITLIGVLSSQVDSAAELASIGIPSPDYIVEGSVGDDTIDATYTGDPEGDMVDANDNLAGDNDDVITAGNGDDSVVAGSGDDTIWGGNDTGNDTLEGGAGNDLINGQAGDDVIDGGADNDSIAAGSGNDSVLGGTGNDSINGGGGQDTLEGGQGDDLISGGDDADSILGDDGDDTIMVYDAFGDDTVIGGEVGETDGDVLNLSNVTTDTTVDLSNSNPETGTVTSGAETITFSEIENIILGGGRDTITLADGSGADRVGAFDMTDSGDGSTNDQLDVSALTSDGGTTPVTTVDTIVSDDGSGNAVLTFPGGESITLVGISPSQLDTIDELVAIGIPDGRDFIVEGTSGNDTIDASYVGDPEGDMVDNFDHSDGSNDDSIEAYGGDDLILSGLGSDTVWGGSGNDTVYGGDGDDFIRGQGGADSLFGEDGADSILGNTGTDYIEGGIGNDTINADGGSDTIFGGAGADSIEGRGNDDQIDGGANNDTLEGGSGADTIEGGTGDDSILGQTGDDLIFGGDGTDTLKADGGTDTVYGGTGNDSINLGAENDVGFGGDGNDTINGGDGDDMIFGDEPLSVNLSQGAAQGQGTSGTEVSGLSAMPTDNLTFEMQYSGAAMTTPGPDDPALSSTLFSYGTAGSPEELSVYAVSDNEIYDLSTPGDLTDTIIETGYVNVEVNGITYTTGITSNSVMDGSGHSMAVTFDATAQELVIFFDGAPAETIALSNNATLETGGTLSFGQSQSTEGGFAGQVTEARLWNDIRSDAEIDQFDDTPLGDEAGDPDLVSNWMPDPFTGGMRDDIGNNDMAPTGGADINVGSGAGDDSISGGDGADTIFGSDGDDTLDGGIGNDSLVGGTGADEYFGGLGDDEMYLAEGDTADGGDGDDLFVLVDLGESGSSTINIVGGEGNETNGDTLQLTPAVSFADITFTNTDDNAGGLSGNFSLADGTIVNFTEIENIICFTPGARILTPQGERAIETLREGDTVITRDHGPQPIRWIGKRTVEGRGKLAPIAVNSTVMSGAKRPLLVSPQHRLLFTGYRAELLFGCDEVLVAAKHLIDGVDVYEAPRAKVTYIHMMFDQHEVVYAEGAATESFHAGDSGMAAISDQSREELFKIFPELRSNIGAYGATARTCLKAHEARLLMPSQAQAAPLAMAA